jgi:hypothetical protein
MHLSDGLFSLLWLRMHLCVTRQCQDRCQVPLAIDSEWGRAPGTQSLASDHGRRTLGSRRVDPWACVPSVTLMAGLDTDGMGMTSSRESHSQEPGSLRGETAASSRRPKEPPVGTYQALQACPCLSPLRLQRRKSRRK